MRYNKRKVGGPMQTIMQAYLDGFHEIQVRVSKQHYHGEVTQFFLRDGSRYFNLEIQEKHDLVHEIRYRLEVRENLELGHTYEILDERNFSVPLFYRFVVKTPEFEEKYGYDKDDLGANYSKTATTFRVWAPTANEVFLRILQVDGTLILPMKRDRNGTYVLRLSGDYEYLAYTYLVHVNGIMQETLDPFARANTPNSKQSVVLDLKKCKHPNRSQHLPLLPHSQDYLIYELHVRDFSSRSKAFQSPGTFSALKEIGITTKTGDPIGLDHLASLGITHVQMMPLLDFASVDDRDPKRFYNWGYDPMSLLALDASFTVDQDDPYVRIRELKESIQAFHERGIRVTLDVVYNHMFDYCSSSLQKTVPYYYFRYLNHDELANGSFCKNDLDTERPMLRKMIVASCKMLLDEFDFDGLRFDLMGMLDIETMLQIEQMAQAIKPDAFLYGEGWNMPSPLPDEQKAMLMNAKKLPKFAFFNDYFRDNITAYVTGDMTKSTYVLDVLKGHHDRDLEGSHQSINYVECHDGMTLLDRLERDQTGEVIRRIALANSLVLFSQGIPFLHMGQEMGRSKQGAVNSYLDSDAINGLDWELVSTHRELVEQTRQMITFRRTHASLFAKSVEDLDWDNCFTTHGHLLHFWLSEGEWIYHFLFNPVPFSVTLPESTCNKHFVLGNVDEKELHSFHRISPLSYCIYRCKNTKKDEMETAK